MIAKYKYVCYLRSTISYKDILFLGMGKKTVQTLAEYRQNMTLEEVYTHLDLLIHMSNQDNGRTELLAYLPALLILFKRLLVEFDNSEMNIMVTNILNNIVAKSPAREKEKNEPKTLIIADVGTEVSFLVLSNPLPAWFYSVDASDLSFPA